MKARRPKVRKLWEQAIEQWQASAYPPGSDMPFNRPLFICVCCREVEKNHDHLQAKGKTRSLEPVCQWCEHERGDTAPTGGAFMDRRMARIVSALANTLAQEAHSKEAGY